MTNSFENYTLLAGSHGRRGSIWRGPDHLLVVEGGGVLFALSETYRRIDYENIQAMSLVRTQRYGWLLAAFISPLALMAVILLIMILAGAGSTQVTAVTIIFGVPLLLVPFILLVVHVARGRTVRCTLQTAVQNLRLRPLTREAKAQEVMANITGICREYQGGTLPEPPPYDPAAAPPPWQAAPRGERPLWNGSPAAIAAGVTVILWGVVLAGELFVGGAGYLVLDTILGAIATVTAVVALVFAMRLHSPTALQVALWISSGLGLVTGFCALMGLGVATAIIQRENMGKPNPNPADAFQYLADLSLKETNAFGWIIVGLGAFISVLGLVMLPYGMRRRPAPADPTPPAMAS
jgi:hypothetical protein